MALPVSHSAIALGLNRSRDPAVILAVVTLALAPDFDFLLVWGFGLPIQSFHRTFSHSLLVQAAAALVWWRVRPMRLQGLGPFLFFLILASHSTYDVLCTADSADHGVMAFWPVTLERFGWPVFVPIYRIFGESPFSWQGFLSFTALECFLAWPFWRLSRSLGNVLSDSE